MTEEKKTEDGAGITAGRDVVFSDVKQLGNAYSDLGEFRKAIEYYNEAYIIAKEIGDKRSEELWLNILHKLKNI